MGVVLLVRHGQASFDAADYDVLSPSGWLQSRVLGRWLAERQVRPDVVLHGRMRRQRETAEGVIDAAGWQVTPETDAGWDEFDHRGVVAAYPHEGPDVPDRREFQRLFTRAVARWTSGEHDGYAEAYPAFAERVLAALSRACDRAGPGGTVLVSSSGGPIAAAVAALLQPDPDPVARAPMWQRLNTVVVNASYSRVIVGASGSRLLTFNEHPHLGPDLLTYR
jgi:broad specificity phosphatase PhoE